MSERIDHAAEAIRLQNGARSVIRTIRADPALPPHMAAVIMLDDARLEAQLGILEQLRIANILKLNEMQMRSAFEPDPETREALGL